MLKKGNIGYTIKPTNIDIGERWITVELENISRNALQNLSVKIQSLDTFGVEVIEGSRFIPQLVPETNTAVHFRVKALFTARVYVSIEGYENDEPFYWESMPQRLKVNEDIAEIAYFITENKPKILLDDKVESEIGILSKQNIKNLRVEFWVEDPEYLIEEVDMTTIENMSAGDMKIVSTTFTPEKKGVYTIYAYIYKGIRRIGTEKMFILVD